jgi:hypothetical protein
LNDTTLITTVVVGLIGVGLLAFGLTQWLFKRFLTSFEKEIGEVKDEVKANRAEINNMRLLLAREYATRGDVKEMFMEAKTDFLNVIRVVVKAPPPPTNTSD